MSLAIKIDSTKNKGALEFQAQFSFINENNEQLLVSVEGQNNTRKLITTKKDEYYSLTRSDLNILIKTAKELIQDAERALFLSK